jgi:hypothetical protein
MKDSKKGIHNTATKNSPPLLRPAIEAAADAPHNASGKKACIMARHNIPTRALVTPKQHPDNIAKTCNDCSVRERNDTGALEMEIDSRINLPKVNLYSMTTVVNVSLFPKANISN